MLWSGQVEISTQVTRCISSKNIQLTMNLIISDVWHHHASQKRYKNKWIADPTSATSPVSPRFCDRPARPCFCSDHKPRVGIFRLRQNFSTSFPLSPATLTCLSFPDCPMPANQLKKKLSSFQVTAICHLPIHPIQRCQQQRKLSILIWLGCKVDPGPSGSRMGVYQYAAVSVDSIPCAKIGK